LNINGFGSNVDGYCLRVEKGGVISGFNLFSFRGSKKRERGRFKSVGGCILTNTFAFLI